MHSLVRSSSESKASDALRPSFGPEQGFDRRCAVRDDRTVAALELQREGNCGAIAGGSREGSEPGDGGAGGGGKPRRRNVVAEQSREERRRVRVRLRRHG